MKVSFPFSSQASSEENNLNTSGLLLLLEKAEFLTAIGQMNGFLGVDAQ